MWFSRRQSKPAKRIHLPVERDRTRHKKKVKGWWQRQSRRLRTVGLGSERAYVLENLSMLLDSGMDVTGSLKAIAFDVRTRQMKRILQDITADIEEGMTLSAALGHVYLFPDHVLSLIRIGEESGRLPENLSVVVTQQEKERTFRSKVRSAMLYPVLVLIIATVIALGMAWFVLPRLVSVFSQLKIDLPLITRLLVQFGEFLRQYGNIVIPAILIFLLVVVYILFGFKKTRWLGQAAIFSLPGVRRLIREVELARFGYVLGTLLEAGLPIVKSLESLEKATTFYSYKKLFDYLKNQINEGHSWQSALRSYKRSRALIPTSIQQLIIAGDTSGRLPEVLLKIGRTFEAKMDTTTKNLTVILEPILLVIVWLGVAGIALAIIMPIYGLVGGLNDRRSGNQSSEATTEATVEPTVIPSPSPSPTSSPNPVVSRLRITETPTNTLNVRVGPGLDQAVITQIEPGGEYEYTASSDEEDGVWYEIVLSDNETGRVSGEYVEVIGNEE